jgi:hypothetical protein
MIDTDFDNPGSPVRSLRPGESEQVSPKEAKIEHAVGSGSNDHPNTVERHGSEGLISLRSRLKLKPNSPNRPSGGSAA